MKICFVGDPRSVHTQRWVRWFADDHEVTFVATDDDDALRDLCVCTLPASGRGLRLVRAVRALRQVVKTHRPDVLHAHFINEAGWFAAASGTRPFVVSAWGSDLYRAPLESRLARRLNPWAVRRADVVTCDSHDQQRILRSWGVDPDRAIVIGWGVDTREFHPGLEGRDLRARLEIPDGASVVLSPRQWIPNSNVETIIRAHAELADDVYLVLKRLPRFEGSGAGRVQAAIDASPARERIRTVGELSGDELPGLYAAADVVVSLASTDGTPVSVLEAMAVGRRIVAYDIPSLAEWVSEPGGRLVASLDAQEVAGAVRALLAAGPEPAGSHNVAIVAERANRAAEMGRMTEVYERLVAGARSVGPRS